MTRQWEQAFGARRGDCLPSALLDDDVAAECPEREAGAAVAERAANRTAGTESRPIRLPAGRTADRDRQVGTYASAESACDQLESGRARQRQPDRSRVRVDAVPARLADRAGIFNIAAYCLALDTIAARIADRDVAAHRSKIEAAS